MGLSPCLNITRDYLLKPSEQPRPLHAILAEVCAKHGISERAFLGNIRNMEVTHARWEAWWRMRTEVGASFPQIGRVSNRDHTTIMHGVRRHTERVSREQKTTVV